MKTTFRNLIAYLKLTSANIKTLHRHLIGGNWFDDHELLGKYYQMIDDMEDSVVETAIFLGYDDISIIDAGKLFNVLEIRDYESKEAFVLVSKYFVKIIELIRACKNEAPAAVVSKLEEYEYDLMLEAKYKLNRFLNDDSFLKFLA